VGSSVLGQKSRRENKARKRKGANPSPTTRSKALNNETPNSHNKEKPHIKRENNAGKKGQEKAREGENRKGGESVSKGRKGNLKAAKNGPGCFRHSATWEFLNPCGGEEGFNGRKRKGALRPR